MALQFASALAPGAQRQIELPNPLDKQDALMKASGFAQNAARVDQDMKRQAAEMQRQDESHARAAKIVDIMAKHGGDFTKALPEISQVDPEFGMEVSRFAEQQRTQQINEAQQRVQSLTGQPGQRTTEYQPFTEDPSVMVPIDKTGPNPAVTIPYRGGDVVVTPPTREELDARAAEDLRKKTDEQIRLNRGIQQAQAEFPEKTATAQTPHTVDTAEGVFQYNPATQRYDIRIGSRPAPADRQLVPVVVAGPQGPMIVDRAKGTAAPVKDASGVSVGLTPTAEERNRGAAVGRVENFMASVSELADKINTGSGLIAKASGALERAKAKANYDDDVAEYQALVQAFTPLWARALGHTGVLTQQDVDSAREALPKPGDSKTLKDRKIARIKTLMKQNNPAPSGGNRVKFDAQGNIVK